MLAKDCKRKVILTGDRPTGKLHLGHFESHHLPLLVLVDH